MCQYTTHPLHIAVYVVKTQLKSHPANYCEKKWLQKIFRLFFNLICQEKPFQEQQNAIFTV